MNVRIPITADTATPAVAQAIHALSDTIPLMDAIGRRVIRDTAAHVRNWGLTHPNKLGGRRTNFWSRIAAKINPGDCLDVTATTATMSLGGPEMPGLSRAFGPVTIVPGTKTPGVKYLAIPARAESYGRRPGEIPGLVLFWHGRQPAGLAQGNPVVRKHDTKKGKAGETYFVPGLVMYWFKDSVTQPQDRTLLPTEDEWSNSATAGAEGWVNAELRKIKGGAQ